MLRFCLDRMAIALLVAVTVSVIGFSMLRLSGDLAAELAGENATPEDIAAVRAANGLDRPLPIQCFDWAGKALRGDFGRSLFSNEPVTAMIVSRLWVTARLAIYSLIFALVFAIPLGVLAATRPNSWRDRSALGVAVFGQAIPNFWFGLILIIVFGVTLRWTPISGSSTLAHFILPTVTLGTSAMPAIMRLTRTGMLDVLDSDFVRTARAKGLLPHTVLLQARAAQRDAAGGVVGGGAARLLARRLCNRRIGVRAQRHRQSRLPLDPAHRFSRGADDPDLRLGDLRAADAAVRPHQRLPGSRIRVG